MAAAATGVHAVLVKVLQSSDVDLGEPLRVDSIQALRILVELEKQFGVEINEEEIFDGWFDSGERIAAYIDRLRTARAP